MDDLHAIPPSSAAAVDAPAPAPAKNNSVSSSNPVSKTNSIKPVPSTGDIQASAATNGGSEVVVEENKSTFKIFQPAERCRKVLEKIWEDSASISFQEPVDTELYDDYLDVVEETMCLRDVLNKLNKGEYSKYFQYKAFQRDMKLIWSNCKAYNLYKSPIWHTAHAFSLMFDRLYQAWVVSYADGSYRLDEPLGAPWETTCRVCLKEHEDDADLMLCDHCDAPYHIYCLSPPLKKVHHHHFSRTATVTSIHTLCLSTRYMHVPTTNIIPLSLFLPLAARCRTKPGCVSAAPAGWSARERKCCRPLSRTRRVSWRSRPVSAR